MGRRRFQIPFEVILGLLLALPCARPAPAEDKGTLPDILIEAEEKRPVQRAKPPMGLEVKEDAPFDSLIKTEDEVRLKLPSEVAKATRFVTGAWESPYVALPAGDFILLAWKGEPAHIFHPLSDLNKVYAERSPKEAPAKASWELAVVDSSGKLFRKFSGSGVPPDQLAFDGKSAEGNWARVGQAYTGVLAYQDAEGRSHTALGRPFALAGLAMQQPGGSYLISLAARQLFDPEKGPGQLSERGARLLDEAAQLIERYHAGLGLAVSANLSRLDPAWVQAASETCSQELARRLLLPRGAVTTRGSPGTKDLEERVDISIGKP